MANTTNINTLWAMIFFLVLLTFFITQLGQTTSGIQTSGFTNQTNTNLSFVSTGYTQVQICEFSSDIPIFGGLIWGADCVADTVSMLFGFSNTSSDVPILGQILLAIIVVIIVIAIIIIRG